MSNFNRVIILGNLTKDPELKYTPNGVPICDFSLAINSFYTDAQGNKKEEATFVPVKVWRKQAELTAEHLKKGRSALIEGRLKQERWTSKDGQPRSRLIVVASIVRFMGKPPQGQDTKQPIEGQDSKTEQQITDDQAEQ